ncbi:MAG TPA: hypothetical protein EYG46_03375, partial [Myxococcales bacterium]|nr:hypothetical protein [Myxococcales bacterium]
MHDGEQAKKLLERAVANSGQDLDRILGDTAYGDSEPREDLASLVAKIIVKLPRQKTHRGCPGANALRREDLGSSVAGYSTTTSSAIARRVVASELNDSGLPERRVDGSPIATAGLTSAPQASSSAGST